MYNREKCIRELIRDDVDTIIGNNNDEYLEMLMLNGFVGYNNQSDEDIIQEMQERGISELFGDNDD